MRILFLVLLVTCAACGSPTSRVPFILIPGLTVPTLEAKFDIKTAPHFYCPKHSKDYEPVYLVTDDLLPGIRDCYISLMLMEVPCPAAKRIVECQRVTPSRRSMTAISQTRLVLMCVQLDLASFHPCSTSK